MSEPTISLDGNAADATGALDTDAAETTPEPAPVRAFYRSDYRRLAENLRRARAAMGSNGQTPKPAEVQAVIDNAAHVLADIFQADSDGHAVAGIAPFNRELFIDGSMLG